MSRGRADPAGLVALDGTKVKANAALDANRTASTIAEQINRMLTEAEATDARSVEPVFGQMKDRQGADRFSIRGLEHCHGEWQLDAAVHNLRKLHRESVRCADDAGTSGRQGRKAA